MMETLQWRLSRTPPGQVAWANDLVWDGTVAQGVQTDHLSAVAAPHGQPGTTGGPGPVPLPRWGALVDVVQDAAVSPSIPAQVPGTAAGAVLAAVEDSAVPQDAESTGELLRHLDDFDWWWITTVDCAEFAGVAEDDGGRQLRLRLRGIATVSEVFWDGQRVGHSVSGLDDVVVDLPVTATTHELALVCRAPGLVPVPKKPRPRWRSTLVGDSSLRWRRTPLIGRIPWAGTYPVVGPWGEAALEPVPKHGLEVVRTHTAVEWGHRQTSAHPGDGDVHGTVHVWVRAQEPVTVRLNCADAAVQHSLMPGDHHLVLEVSQPALWWPATHGDPVLHTLTVSAAFPAAGAAAFRTVYQAEVGFRHLRADTADGGFALVVNGCRIFARGAVWTPPDSVNLWTEAERVERGVLAMRMAGANVLRISGTHAWETDAFYQACDRYGVLVWQDAMLATLDPPSEDGWVELITRELKTWLPRLGAHPSVAVISGGNEVLQQPVLYGRNLSDAPIPVIEKVLPELCDELIPHCVHVASSPSGGNPPTRPDTGISHWFGVGAYRRPLTDTRVSGVRFAAEALAFGVPPAPSEITAAFGSPTADHNDDARAAWSGSTARDPGATWDFEQTTAHYARRWLEPGCEADTGAAGAEAATHGGPASSGGDFRPGVWAHLSRSEQLAAERTAAGHAVEHTMTDLRRGASGCDGVVVLASRDFCAGAGWGLLDHTGRPKATWYAMRRACADTAVRLVDEGLSGLHIHVFHDPLWPLTGMMYVKTFTRHNAAGPSGQVRVEVDGGAEAVWNVEQILGGFLDLDHAWGFGQRQWEAVSVELVPDEPSGGLAEPLGDAVEALDGVAESLRGSTGDGQAAQRWVRSLRDVKLLGGGHRDALVDLEWGMRISGALVPGVPEAVSAGELDGVCGTEAAGGARVHTVGLPGTPAARGVSVDVGAGWVPQDDVMTFCPGDQRILTAVPISDWPQCSESTHGRNRGERSND